MKIDCILCCCSFSESTTSGQRAKTLLEATKIAFNPLNLLTKIEIIDAACVQTMINSLKKFEEQLQHFMKQLLRTPMDKHSNQKCVKVVYLYALQATVDRTDMNAFAEFLKTVLLKIQKTVNSNNNS